LLYVNDIGNSVPNTPIKLYADDTNTFIHGNTAESLTGDAEKHITSLNAWFTVNKLSVASMKYATVYLV